MFLRTASLIVAGAMLAGCESSRVSGNASYYDDGRVIGDRSFRDGSRMSGEMAYRHGGDANNADSTADARTAAGTLDADRGGRSPEVTKSDTPRTDLSDKAASKDPAAADNRPVIQPGMADPERAAYAATAKFPADAKAINEVPLTVSVDKDRDELIVRNDSDQAMHNVNVWIDGRYVAWVGQIPAHDRVSFRKLSFSDSQGRGIKDWSEVNSVQLQSNDRLFNTTGMAKRL